MRQHLGPLALAAVLVVGCSRLGAVNPSASPIVTLEPTPSASLLPPTDTPSPTEAPANSPAPPVDLTTPAPTEAPSQEPTFVAQPTLPDFSPLPVATIGNPSTADIDHFWSQFLELSCVEFGMEDYWDSVTQMAKDVEVVIVGHPTSVTVRSDDGTNIGGTGIVSIAVDDVLRGSPQSQHPDVIEITDEGEGSWTAAADWTDWPHAPIANTETILFLRNEAAKDLRYGQAVQPGDEYLYYMPGVHQNVLTELDGKVYVPQTPRMRKWYGNDFFPLPLEGMSWDKLLAMVTEAVNSASAGGGVRGPIKAAC